MLAYIFLGSLIYIMFNVGSRYGLCLLLQSEDNQMVVNSPSRNLLSNSIDEW